MSLLARVHCYAAPYCGTVQGGEAAGRPPYKGKEENGREERSVILYEGGREEEKKGKSESVITPGMASKY